MIKLETPLTIEKVESLRAGDQVLLSGTIYTGRDAAHKRFVEALKNNEPLPFDPYDQVIRDGLYPGGRKLITFANILQHDVFLSFRGRTG